MKISLLAFGAILAYLALGGPQEVFAHATPITYEPKSSSVLPEPPGRIRIFFSERIEEKASGIAVLGPDGQRTNTGPAFVDTADAHYFQVPFVDAGEGTYTVSWQVVSADDGHFTKGAFTFSVGEETATQAVGQIQVQHVTRVPQAAATGLELLGQAMMLGAAFLFVFFWRPARARFPAIAPLEETIRKRTAFLVGAAAFFVLLGSVGFVVIKTFDLQTLRAGGFWETLAVFLQTNDGSFAVARGLLGLLFGGLFLARIRHLLSAPRVSKTEYVLWILVTLMILARARISHAAASSFLPEFSVAINALQLAAKEWWVGGSILLAAVLIPLAWQRHDGILVQFLQNAFSRVTALAIGILAVTGLYIVWLHGKGFSYLLQEEWAAKAAFVIFLTSILGLFRLFHLLVIERTNSPRLLGLSRLTIPLEALIGVLLLFATAVSLLTTPFYPGQEFSFLKQAESQGTRLELTVHPQRTDFFLVKAYASGTKEERRLQDIAITLRNQGAGLGPLVAKTEQISRGGFVFPREEFPIPGEWGVSITAQQETGYDATANFSFQYPEAVEASAQDASQHSFGAFGALLLAMAIGGAGTGFLLWRLALTNRERIEKAAPLEILTWKASLTPLGILAGLLLVLSLSSLFGKAIKTDFQSLCEKNGDFWIQSVPMRDYQPLSASNVTGCTLEVGLFHVADKSEYEYFRQPAQTASELVLSPETPRAGEPTEMTLQVSQAREGRRLEEPPELSIYHDRIVHVIVIGEDLETFAHLHPEDLRPVTQEQRESGRYPFRYAFPAAGRYLVAVDYVVHGEEVQELFPVIVEGSSSLERAKALSFSRIKQFGEYEVAFKGPDIFRAREQTRFSYHISKNGVPVQDLQPYLAAAMHIFAVREDLNRGTHTHGEVYPPGSLYVQKYLQLAGLGNYHTHFVPEAFGPTIEAGISLPFAFPSAGIYTVFGEFQHEGEVILTNFTVEVQ